MSPVELAYAKMLLGIMEECNKNMDCSDCKNKGVCVDSNIPNETAHMFAMLIEEAEKST